MKQPKILFLRIENRARSQMAEAFLRKYAGDQFEVYSAGLDPSPIHPYVYQVMEEVGMDLEGQHPKGVDDFLNKMYFGILITVCDDAAENCPVWLGGGRKEHLGFPDPAAAKGSEEERLEVFRKARDGLREEALSYLEEVETATRGNYAA